MKRTYEIPRMVRGSGLAVATILIATFMAVAPASAQYKPTGNDGITTSPKVRAQLDERKARTTLVSAPAMACAKCKDAWVAKSDTHSKGAGARSLIGQNTKLVVRHLCEACGAEIATAGAGKAKYAVVAHTCNGCGSANLACCGPKAAGDVATKGMEQPVQVAPLK